MASKAAARAAAGVVEVSKKQTLQSTGIYDKIRRAFALDPERSSGVPLNPVYRNPPPGANDPLQYDDLVTVPAGDIADNYYFNRDVRRSYPQTSVFSQSDVVGLLSVGSAANPKVELIGEAGEKALVAAKEEGDKGGLSVYFQKGTKSVEEAKKDTFIGGLPPTPSGQNLKADGAWSVHKYKPETEGSYSEEYPVRSFT